MDQTGPDTLLVGSGRARAGPRPCSCRTTTMLGHRPTAGVHLDMYTQERKAGGHSANKQNQHGGPRWHGQLGSSSSQAASRSRLRILPLTPTCKTRSGDCYVLPDPLCARQGQAFVPARSCFFQIRTPTFFSRLVWQTAEPKVGCVFFLFCSLSTISNQFHKSYFVLLKFICKVARLGSTKLNRNDSEPGCKSARAEDSGFLPSFPL